MASISVTINTPASGPFNLAKLFAGNTYAGAVTIAPVVPLVPQSKPNYVGIQADPSNGANFIYVGDAKMTPTNAGAWGKKLAAGVVDAVQNVNEALAQRYVNASAATAIVNIEVLGGFQ
jgi:hypothetical protein